MEFLLQKPGFGCSPIFLYGSLENVHDEDGWLRGEWLIILFPRVNFSFQACWVTLYQVLFIKSITHFHHNSLMLAKHFYLFIQNS